MSTNSREIAFGEWVKARRKLLGLSRKTLAARVGCSPVTLVKIEGGERRPSVQVAELLAKGLELSAEDEIEFTASARRALFGSNAQVVASVASSEQAESPVGGEARAAIRARNLPAHATSFIGREESVREAQALLRGPARLLTFTGPPGIGKTRISLRVAEGLLGDFADGSFFVALAPVRDPDMVPLAIAQALEVRDSAKMTVADRLKQYLEDKEMLLVLDNFEQVIPAAPLLGELLQSARNLKIIASSRETLHIYGEHNYPVEPLSLPGSDFAPEGIEGWLEYEAVRLFAERSRAARHNFALTDANAPMVAEICARLDRLPLAIELAAARTQTMSLEQILQQLDNRLNLLQNGPRDLPLRQQTLQYAIDWSYNLLDEAEQALFSAMAVFRGGANEQGIGVVAGVEDSTQGEERQGKQGYREVAQSLLAKSLLRQERGSDGVMRYVMLETIREYAGEKLVERGEAIGAQSRHSRFYCELAMKAQQNLKGPDQARWLEKLDVEHQNLLAALEWFATSGGQEDAQVGLGMALALWRFWEIRGYLIEGRKWLATMLERPQTAERTETRSSTLRAAGRLALLQGDYGAARTLYEESLGISEELGDTAGISSALFNLGFVSFDTGDYKTARAYYEAALPLLSEIGDRYFQAGALFSLGNMAAQDGEYALAEARYNESLRMYHQIEDPHGIGNALLGLGELARLRGDYEAAYALNSRGLNIWEKLGHKLNTALTLHNLGYAEKGRGQLSRAHSLFARALAIYKGIDERPGLAECVVGLAVVAAAASKPEKAARLIGVADGLMEDIGYALSGAERKEYDLARNRCRSLLDAERTDGEYERAVEAGEKLTFEQAVAYAMDESYLVPMEIMGGGWSDMAGEKA